MSERQGVRGILFDMDAPPTTSLAAQSGRLHGCARKLIEEIGAEAYLRQLIQNLRGE